MLAQRTREFGIRLALGATPELLWQRLMTRHLAFVGLGVVPGSTVAAAKAPILAAFLYQVTSRDIATFVVVGLTVIAIAALACIPMLRRLNTSRSYKHLGFSSRK
jgi:ABC-type antimicrobial peptide transport system permease subunit